MIPSISAPRRSSSVSASRRWISSLTWSPLRTGTKTGSTLSPKVVCAAATTPSWSARAWSSFETTTARGMPTAAHSRQRWRVPASIGLFAATTNSALSAARSPARTSPPKSAYPGVSIRLILTPSWTSGATARETERWWACSDSSKSDTVVPSSTVPDAGDRSGVCEQRLDEGGLARAVGPDQDDVADPVGPRRFEVVGGCLPSLLVRHGNTKLRTRPGHKTCGQLCETRPRSARLASERECYDGGGRMRLAVFGTGTVGQTLGGGIRRPRPRGGPRHPRPGSDGRPRGVVVGAGPRGVRRCCRRRRSRRGCRVRRGGALEALGAGGDLTRQR